MTNILNDDIFDLASIALEVARTHPDRIAVIEPDGHDAGGKRRYKKYTYRQLSADVEAVAPGLREMGIREGTRTVFMAPPSYGACVIGVALTRVGAATVWIDPAVGYLNVGERLRRIEPEAFVGIPLTHLGRVIFGWGSRFLRKLIVIGKPGFPGAQTMESLRRTAPAHPQPPAVQPTDLAGVMYTTGSTGPAKPALYEHRNFSQLYRVMHESWRFAPERVVPVDMAVFPSFLFIALSAGGTMVVPPINFAIQSPAKADPKALLEVINDCGVQTLFGSPVLLENMARYAVQHGVKTPKFKRAIGGGAPIYKSVKEALLSMMGPEGEVFSNYGATEALPSTEMGAQEALRETFALTARGAGVCVGRPMTGVELRVIRIQDGVIPVMEKAEILASGEIGEILVRGRHISPGYFRDEGSNRKNKIQDANGGQWHRLGDAGYLDTADRLWVCGRVGQRVKAAGGSVFSLLCEPIFDAHPAVRRSGLVGVPGEKGEIPVICVEVAETAGISTAQLTQELLALAAANPATQSIHHVLFHRKLPVDPRHNSKIERPKLALWAARRMRGVIRGGRPS